MNTTEATGEIKINGEKSIFYYGNVLGLSGGRSNGSISPALAVGPKIHAPASDP
ncbi:MAG: hypothetical protein JW913_01525 [Chitinispirillaceae bacterium]|nr:hypothetical protein [Chitinispirillaceae bacterium]